MEFNSIKLSSFVDEFLVDNISNMTCDFNDASSNEFSYHINQLQIEQYFPKHHNINYNILKIDDIGKYSITLPKKADTISELIKKYCNITGRQIIITDATAGVGGNVLSFCKYNYIVNAVEIDNERFHYLKHNIKEYKYDNMITLYNDNYINIFENLVQDVIFIDPPWGGLDYKKTEDITLKLGDIEIEELCNIINNKKLAKLTVLKLPFNYNLNYIKRMVHQTFTIYKLKNILLVLIINN